jgi:hypothetical protein
VWIADRGRSPILNLAGGVVYETTQTDVSEISWDGTNTFDGNGKLFVNR